MAKDKGKGAAAAPATPVMTSVKGVDAGFGKLSLNGGKLNFKIKNNENLAASQSLAETMMRNGLEGLQNPAQFIDKQRTISRNAMVPAYELGEDQARSDLVSRLGNRNASTFGALTADKAALLAAASRAQLESDIEDQSQQAFDREISRATQYGAIGQGIQAYRMDPYTTLASILGTGGGVVNGANSNLANIYGAQSSFAGQQLQANATKSAARSQMWAQLGSAALGAGASMAKAAAGVPPI